MKGGWDGGGLPKLGGSYYNGQRGGWGGGGGAGGAGGADAGGSAPAKKMVGGGLPGMPGGGWGS